jgi:indolepyruvate ferredoxin oxidoreductase beta subunit
VIARPRGERLRILLVGVGGQGVLTAARVLGEAALACGREVVVGQLHGMAQRGGSVEASVLIGPGRSAFIGPGEAGVVAGFEPLETLRARPKMSPGAVVVVSRGGIVPPAMTRQGLEYPDFDGILAGIREVTAEIHVVDGPAVVREAGLEIALNAAMLGALSAVGVLPFDERAVWGAIEARCPPGQLEANRLAFRSGGESIRQRSGREPIP